MHNVYFVSGLGADHRVFQFLTLHNVKQTHICWIAPKNKENIQDYALRLIAQIDTSQPVILIGVSFGGIIAQEIAQHIPTEKVIIISSIKSWKELSLPMRLIRATQFHKLFPTPLLQWLNLLTANYYFGIESPQESKLLKTIIKDSDEAFTLWAMDAIINWKSNYQTPNLVHLHGTKDRIFPNKNIKNVQWIEQGGHFMIANKADEISKWLNSSWS